MHVRDIFLAAIDHDRPTDRAAYLDRACGGDTKLRERVAALLHADAASDGFLQSPLAGADVTEEPPHRVGPFELREAVGRGGMGVVYRAWDVRLDRDVAVKLLQGRATTDPAATTRFRHEARVTARLAHPGVPPVHDVGELPDGRPYLAMKLVEGRSLHELLATRPDPAHDRGRLVAAFEQVCQAVAFAHSRGILHRDLKPANVMVGAFGEVQVMDWGLAKDLTAPPDNDPHAPIPGSNSGSPDGAETLVFWSTARPTPAAGDSDDTRAGMVLGTPGYMAPEQARGEPADRRSDVFGLGAVLCEVLTGSAPFAGPSTADTLRQNAGGDPTEARQRLAGCGADQELVALCERCLSPLPADRPADAGVVAAEVAAWRGRTEERARQAEVGRAEATVRVRELRKRRLVWLGLAGVSVVGFTAAVVLAVWTNQARRAADTARLQAEEETNLANDVKDFLRYDVLQLANPSVQKEDGGLPYDANVRLRDVVLRASKRIDGKFPDRPRVEADLRNTLGYALLGMGLTEAAVPHLERARAAYAATLGPDHPDTLRCSHNLGDGYTALKRYPEALALREAVVASRRATFGEDHPDTLTGLNALAVCQNVMGQHQAAVPLLDDVLDRRRRVLGPDHPDVYLSMEALSYALTAAGGHRQHEAVGVLQEALAGVKRTRGPDHPITLRILYGLANRYDSDRRYSEAVVLREEALSARRKSLGEDHPLTLESVEGLAFTYTRLGRRPEAVALWEQLLGMYSRTAGLTHPNTLRIMHNLAFTYAAMGRHRDALARREERLSAMVNTLGRDHADTEIAESQVIESLIELDRADDAWPRVEATLARADRAAAAGRPGAVALRPYLLELQARICHGRKDAEGLRRTTERLAAMANGVPESVYAVASCHASLAGLLADDLDRAQAADRSIEWLAKAIAAGYRDRAAIDIDAKFDALRKRADFRELIGTLAYQAPPPPPAAVTPTTGR